MESLLNTGGAFRPQIVKVGALSAPTQDMLLKYCLDLSYIQIGICGTALFIFVGDMTIYYVVMIWF